MNTIQGKALVVGANGGMGRAVALALAQQGIECALMGRNEEAITAVARSCMETGSNAYPVVCDIARTETIEMAVVEAIDMLGGLNYLINCAGISPNGVNTYLAANRGGEGLAEALFEDVREFGTRVCNIKPGWVNTPLVEDENGIDPALMIQPGDIAQAVMFVLAMPVTACVTEMTILPQRLPYI